MSSSRNVNEADQMNLSRLLQHALDGDFYRGCIMIGMNEFVAMDKLLKEYPLRRKEIITRMIGESEPAEIDDIHIGNYEQKAEIIKTIESTTMVTDGRNKFYLQHHAIIFGDAGVGKTSFVNKLKKYYDVIDVNASNQRTLDDMIVDIAGVSDTESLLSKPKLVFFDEMDSMAPSGYEFLRSLVGPPTEDIREIFGKILSGDHDKKVVAKYAKMRMLIKHRCQYPILMACNNIDSVNVKLKQNDRVHLIRFLPPENHEIEILVRAFADKISDNEVNIESTYDDDFIKNIVNSCHGDVRLAKNMVTSGGETYEQEAEYKPIDIVYHVFTSKNREQVREILDEMKYSVSTILSYISFNIVKYYSKLSEILYLQDLVSFIDTMKFKIPKEYVVSILAFSFPPSKYPMATPSYPVKSMFANVKKVSKNGKKGKKTDS